MGKADKEFLIEYRHQGADWCLTLHADDEDDARRKLRAIGTNGHILGEAVLHIGVPGWGERLLRWLGFVK